MCWFPFTNRSRMYFGFPALTTDVDMKAGWSG